MQFKSQDRIKRQLAHIINVHKESKAHIRPHFFLTGPSGSGKSFLAQQAAEESGLGFFEINAAQLTAEGLSGNSLSKALRPLRERWDKPNIIFVDEFDKLFQRNGETTEGFRSAVQDEFLAVLEGKTTSVFTDYGKYEPVKIDNSLFIFAGAFNNQIVTTVDELKDMGLRTEFVGRVPLVFCTQETTIEELLEAVPHLTLFKNYVMLQPNGYNVGKAVKEIRDRIKKSDLRSSLGIRLLNATIHAYFMRNV